MTDYSIDPSLTIDPSLSIDPAASIDPAVPSAVDTTALDAATTSSPDYPITPAADSALPAVPLGYGVDTSADPFSIAPPTQAPVQRPSLDQQMSTDPSQWWRSAYPTANPGVSPDQLPAPAAPPKADGWLGSFMNWEDQNLPKPIATGIDSALQSIIPTAAGLLGGRIVGSALGGAAAGALAGLGVGDEITIPAGFIIGAIGGLIGGGGASAATAAGQDKVMQSLLGDQNYTAWQYHVQQEQQGDPIASEIGSLVSMMPYLRPGNPLGAFKLAGEIVGSGNNMAKIGALLRNPNNQAAAEQMMNIAFGVGTQAGQTALAQHQQGIFDPAQLAASAIGAAILNKSTRLGRVLMGGTDPAQHVLAQGVQRADAAMQDGVRKASDAVAPPPADATTLAPDLITQISELSARRQRMAATGIDTREVDQQIRDLQLQLAQAHQGVPENGAPVPGFALDRLKAQPTEGIGPLGPDELPAHLAAKAAQSPAATVALRTLMPVGDVHIVGGAIRNAVAGKAIKDLDLVFAGSEDQLKSSLQDLVDNDRTGQTSFVKTGDHFPVYRLTVGPDQVEIALPRSENPLNTNDIQVGGDITGDMDRRDFTINGVALHTNSGQLIDPHNGIADTQNRVLRTISPTSFTADPLRMLRALRFIGEGYRPDPTLLEQMRSNAWRLGEIPAERIQQELDRVFGSDHPEAALEIMRQTGLLKYIFPDHVRTVGFDQKNPYHDQQLWDHMVGVTERTAQLNKDPDVRLAAFLHDVGKPDTQAFRRPENPDHASYHGHEDRGAVMAREILSKLKYPTDRVDKIVFLVQNHMFPADQVINRPTAFLAKMAEGLSGRPKDVQDAIIEQRVRDLMDIREADQYNHSNPNDGRVPEMKAALAQVANMPNKRSDINLNGNDLKDIGLTPGPLFSKILNQIDQEVIGQMVPNEKEALIQRAKEIAGLNTDASTALAVARATQAMPKPDINTLGALRERVPGDERLGDIPGNPRTAVDGGRFTDKNPGELGPTVALEAGHLDTLFRDHLPLHEDSFQHLLDSRVNPAADPNTTLLQWYKDANGRWDFRVNDDFVARAFARSNAQRYDYEIFAESLKGGNLQGISQDELRNFINLFGVTSQNTSVQDNMSRAVSLLSEMIQGRPFDTDVIDPRLIQQALRHDVIGDQSQNLKLGNFTQTIHYLTGGESEPPLATNDVWMSRIFGMKGDGDTFNNENVYAPFSRFQIGLGDAATKATGQDEPYRAWQVQAQLWHEVGGSSTLKDAFLNVANQLEAAGIPVGHNAQGEPVITRDTLSDPRTPDVLRGDTRSRFQQAPIMTLEAGTYNNEVGARASQLYRQIESSDNPKLQAHAQTYRDTLVRTMLDSKLALENAVDALMAKQREGLASSHAGISHPVGKDILSRTEGARISSDGSYNGEVSPNLRIPVPLGSGLRRLLAALVGYHLNQSAVAISSFRPLAEGEQPSNIGAPTFFFQGHNLTPQEKTTLAQAIREVGPHDIQIRGNAAGDVLYVMPDFEAWQPAPADKIADILINMGLDKGVQEWHSDMLSDQHSDYVESSDYPEAIAHAQELALNHDINLRGIQSNAKQRKALDTYFPGEEGRRLFWQGADLGAIPEAERSNLEKLRGSGRYLLLAQAQQELAAAAAARDSALGLWHATTSADLARQGGFRSALSGQVPKALSTTGEQHGIQQEAAGNPQEASKLGQVFEARQGQEASQPSQASGTEGTSYDTTGRPLGTEPTNEATAGTGSASTNEPTGGTSGSTAARANEHATTGTANGRTTDGRTATGDASGTASGNAGDGRTTDASGHAASERSDASGGSGNPSDASIARAGALHPNGGSAAQADAASELATTGNGQANAGSSTSSEPASKAGIAGRTAAPATIRRGNLEVVGVLAHHVPYVNELLDRIEASGLNKNGIVKRIEVIGNGIVGGIGGTQVGKGGWDWKNPGVVQVNLDSVIHPAEIAAEIAEVGNQIQSRMSLRDQGLLTQEEEHALVAAQAWFQRLQSADEHDWIFQTVAHEFIHALTANRLGLDTVENPDIGNIAYLLARGLNPDQIKAYREVGLNDELTNLLRFADVVDKWDGKSPFPIKTSPEYIDSLNTAALRVFEHIGYDLQALENTSLHPYSLASEKTYEHTFWNQAAREASQGRTASWYDAEPAALTGSDLHTTAADGTGFPADRVANAQAANQERVAEQLSPPIALANEKRLRAANDPKLYLATDRALQQVQRRPNESDAQYGDRLVKATGRYASLDHAQEIVKAANSGMYTPIERNGQIYVKVGDKEYPGRPSEQVADWHGDFRSAVEGKPGRILQETIATEPSPERVIPVDPDVLQYSFETGDPVVSGASGKAPEGSEGFTEAPGVSRAAGSDFSDPAHIQIRAAIAHTGRKDAFIESKNGTRYRVMPSNYGLFGRVQGPDVVLEDGSTVNAKHIQKVVNGAGRTIWERPEPPPAVAEKMTMDQVRDRQVDNSKKVEETIQAQDELKDDSIFDSERVVQEAEQAAEQEATAEEPKIPAPEEAAATPEMSILDALKPIPGIKYKKQQIAALQTASVISNFHDAMAAARNVGDAEVAGFANGVSDLLHELTRGWDFDKLSTMPQEWWNDTVRNIWAIRNQYDTVGKMLTKLIPDEAANDRIRASLDVRGKTDVEKNAARQAALALLSPEERAISDLLHNYWQVTGNLAQRLGVFKYYLEHYLPHIVTMDGEGNRPFDTTGGLSKNTRHAIQRVVDFETGQTLFETIDDLKSHLGTTGQVKTGLGDIFAAHGQGMSQAILMRQFLGRASTDLEMHSANGYADRPIVSKARFGKLPAAWQKELVPGESLIGPAQRVMSGYYIHKDLAERMNRLASVYEMKGGGASGIAKVINRWNTEFKTYKFISPMHAWSMLSNIGTLGSRTGLFGIPAPLDPQVWKLMRLGHQINLNNPELRKLAVRAGFPPPRMNLPEDIGGFAHSFLQHVPGYKLFEHWMWDRIGYEGGLGLWAHLREQMLNDYAKSNGELDPYNPDHAATVFQIEKEAADHARRAVGLINNLDMTKDWHLYGGTLFLANKWTTGQLRAMGTTMGIQRLANLGGGERFRGTPTGGDEVKNWLEQKNIQMTRRLVLGGMTRLLATSMLLSTGVSALLNGGMPSTPMQNWQRDPSHVFDIYAGRDATTNRDKWIHMPFYLFQREMVDWATAAVKAMQLNKNIFEVAKAPIDRFSSKANPITKFGFEMLTGREFGRWMNGYGNPDIDSDKYIQSIHDSLNGMGVPDLGSLENRVIYAIRSFSPGINFPTNLSQTTTDKQQVANALGIGTLNILSQQNLANTAMGLVGTRMDQGTIYTTDPKTGQEISLDAYLAQKDAQQKLADQMTEAAKNGDFATVEQLRQQLGMTPGQAWQQINYGSSHSTGTGGLLIPTQTPGVQINPKTSSAAVLAGHPLSPQQEASYYSIQATRQDKALQLIMQDPAWKSMNMSQRQAAANAIRTFADKITTEQVSQALGFKPGQPISNAQADSMLSEALVLQKTSEQLIQNSTFFKSAAPDTQKLMLSERQSAAQSLVWNKYFGNLKGATTYQLENMLNIQTGISDQVRAFVPTLPGYQNATSPYEQDQIMARSLHYSDTIVANMFAGKPAEKYFGRPLSQSELAPIIRNSLALQDAAMNMLHQSSIYTSADVKTQGALDTKYANLAHRVAIYDSGNGIQLNTASDVYSKGFAPALQAQLMADEGYQQLVDSYFGPNGQQTLQNHTEELAMLKARYAQEANLTPAQITKAETQIGRWYSLNNPDYAAFLAARTQWESRNPIGQLYTAMNKDALTFASSSPFDALAPPLDDSTPT